MKEDMKKNIFFFQILLLLCLPNIASAIEAEWWLSPGWETIQNNREGEHDAEFLSGVDCAIPDIPLLCSLGNDNVRLRAYSLAEPSLFGASWSNVYIEVKRQFRVPAPQPGHVWNIALEGTLRGVLLTNDTELAKIDLCESFVPSASVNAKARIISPGGQTTNTVDFFDIACEENTPNGNPEYCELDDAILYFIEKRNDSILPLLGVKRGTSENGLPPGDYTIIVSLETSASVAHRISICSASSKADFYHSDFPIIGRDLSTIDTAKLGWEVGVSATQIILDADGDGVPDDLDICPDFDDYVDVDGDGTPDGCDTNNNDGPLGDLDNDGVTNNNDICPDTPADEQADTNGCGPSQKDSDGDNVPDNLDICPDFDDYVDVDGDGEPDGCDTNNNDGPLGDLDNDGVTNNNDTCLDTPADEQADANGCGPSQKDSDGDGVNDKDDLFPLNPLRWTHAITPMLEILLLSPIIIEGDLDNDGCVDRADLNEILMIIRGSAAPDLVANYDLNGDGAVNIADARYLVTLFTNPRGAPCD